jgi:hypothetical protein
MKDAQSRRPATVHAVDREGRPRPERRVWIGLWSDPLEGFPATTRLLDVVKSLIEGGLYSHFGGVEQDGVGGA